MVSSEFTGKQAKRRCQNGKEFYRRGLFEQSEYDDTSRAGRECKVQKSTLDNVRECLL